jgi:hypothetical protein
METLTGIATAVTFSTQAWGEYGEKQTHGANFLVGGTRQVHMQATRRPMINDGDLIVVAGKDHHSGVLEVLAYRNVSLRVRGNTGLMPSLYGAIAFPTLVWWGTRNGEHPGFVAFLLLFAAGASLWCLFSAAQIAAAEISLARADP